MMSIIKYYYLFALLVLFVRVYLFGFRESGTLFGQRDVEHNYNLYSSR